MTSIQNVRELSAGMMLTGNIKSCLELYYSKLLTIIDLKYNCQPIVFVPE